MNGHPNGLPPQGNDQSALSLLVNAADNHDPPRGSRDPGGGIPSRGLAEALRLRGLADQGASLEEQLLLQQQAQNAYGMAGGGGGGLGLLSQLREQSLLSQLGGQNPQLASLLGLGGGGGGNLPPSDMRSALAAAQLRQQPPRLPPDLLALSRGGNLGGFSGLLGANRSGGASGLASELEGLQRLEERRQHLLAASGGAPLPGSMSGSMSGHQLDNSGGHASTGLSREELMERMARSEAANNAAAAAAAAASVTSSRPPPPAPAAEPSTEGPSEMSKEELEKAPGSVIVPCRARGMPMDHNFKTAYFVIPENVKHGEELICSYFACRNAGIKFRYCSHCKVPVAKRNFRKRHKHGGDPGATAAGADDSGAEDDYPRAKKGIPAQIMAKHEDGTEADGLSSQSTDSNGEMEKGLVRISMRSLEKEKPGTATKAKGGKISKTRQERWAHLLGKRPATKDGDSMSAWLMEVLSVSDLDTPLKEEEEDVPLCRPTTASPVKTETPAAPPANDIRSEPDDGSSNDESADKETATSGAAATATTGATTTAVKEEKASSTTMNGGIVKKKRPTESLTDDDSPNAGTDSFVSGSFAEWKERKRQKKQGKPESATKAESPAP